MANEGKASRRALVERLKAKRRAKETELARQGAGEGELCDQDVDLKRLEELAAEVRTSLRCISSAILPGFHSINFIARYGAHQ